MTDDPLRVRRITDKLRAAWTHEADTRLGELVMGLAGERDLAQLSDDELETALDEFLRNAAAPRAGG